MGECIIMKRMSEEDGRKRQPNGSSSSPPSSSPPPEGSPFADEDVQETLRQMLISALRHDAQKYLPARLKALAKKYGFEIGAIRINGSRTR